MYHTKELSSEKIQDAVEEAVRTYRTDFIPKKTQSSSSETAGFIAKAGFIGDIVGMPYERRGVPDTLDPDTAYLFPKNADYTDESIIIAATMHALDVLSTERDLSDEQDIADLFNAAYREAVRRDVRRLYTPEFLAWAMNENEEIGNSDGNESAVRAGVIGARYGKQEDVIRIAVLSSVPSHFSQAGIRGAAVTAMSVWLALHGASKDEILQYAVRHYPNGFRTFREMAKESFSWTGEPKWMAPDISMEELIRLSPNTIRITGNVCVPEAIACFMHGGSFEETLRNILRFRCDSDSVGSIAAQIAAAYYGRTVISGAAVNSELEQRLNISENRF